MAGRKSPRGSVVVVPGEPQTAVKAAEEKAGAPARDDSEPEADDEDEEEEEEDEEEARLNECALCYSRPVVYDQDTGERLCKVHDVERCLEEWRENRGEEQESDARSGEQLARETELERLKRRRAAGQASDSESDGGETTPRKRARREHARETLRVRYALRHGEEVVRCLRNAVRGTDAASAAAVQALAALLPPQRFTPQARPARARAALPLQPASARCVC